MIIHVQVQKTESKQIEIPNYFRSNSETVHYINEKGTIISLNAGQITIWPTTAMLYQNMLSEVTKGEEVDEEVFEKALSRVKDIIQTELGTKL